MNKQICAIIQARMTSTRLPGKVLMEINKKPIILHIIERLKKCGKIDDIILAIPSTNESDILEKYARIWECRYFRGSETDVLSRYYHAAKKYSADNIVRITGDCPLVDPKLIEQMVEHFIDEQTDYAAIGIEGYFPRGIDAEIFSFKTLEKVNTEAQHIYEREHVTPYIYEHPELFKIRFIEAPDKLRRPEIRLTVDTQEDFNLVREIFKNLYIEEQLFYTEDVIKYLDSHPESLSINALVSQKEMREL
jgi:spore coat polysaccharide biosynthesis protein SpsF